MKQHSKFKPFVIILIIGVLLGIFIGFGLVQFSYIGPHEVQTTTFNPVSYTDFVTILLSVITVLIAIMGIFFAVLAVFGFSAIKNTTVKEAQSKAESVIDDSLQDGGKIFALIIDRLENDFNFREEVSEVIARSYIASTTSEEAEDDNEDEDDDG